MDWFLYDIGLRHERVKGILHKINTNKSKITSYNEKFLIESFFLFLKCHKLQEIVEMILNVIAK